MPSDSVLPSGMTWVPNFSNIMSALPWKPPVQTQVALALIWISLPSASVARRPVTAPSSTIRPVIGVFMRTWPPLSSIQFTSGMKRSSPDTEYGVTPSALNEQRT